MEEEEQQALGFKRKRESLTEIMRSARKKEPQFVVKGQQPVSAGIPADKLGIPRIKAARMKLFETCASNYWKAPLFELCQEEGPVPGRMFIYKVTVVVDTITTTILECFSEPKRQKKAAREHAAEGALWYLKHLGFLQRPQDLCA